MWKSLVCRPGFAKGTVFMRPVTLRRYTRSNSDKHFQSKREDLPGIGKLLLVTLVGTVIFRQAVQSLDKNKPKASYSEQEYENIVKGLKRKVAIFPPGSINITFVPYTTPELRSLLQKKNPKIRLIDPEEIVETTRANKNDPYEPLLNELAQKYGSTEYLNHLPRGMLVKLLGSFMQTHCKEGDDIALLGFPQTIQDANRFETEISTVSEVLISKQQRQTAADPHENISEYYQTVNKVKEV